MGVLGLIPASQALRDKMAAIEAYLPPCDLPVREFKMRGVYAREISIPAGHVLTGRVHKFENLNIMSAGRVSLVTDGEPVVIEAPYTIVSPAGTKRVAYAHTDTVWTTICRIDDDVEDVVSALTTADYKEYLEFHAPTLGAN